MSVLQPDGKVGVQFGAEGVDWLQGAGRQDQSPDLAAGQRREGKAWKAHSGSLLNLALFYYDFFSQSSGLEWHKIKTLGLVLSCVVKVIPLPVFLETMTIQCGTGQLLF